MKLGTGTGCISIVNANGDPTPVDRVIEYLQPKDGTVWVDICLFNNSDRDQRYWILHRGSLTARNITLESWLPNRTRPRLDLTERIRKLHHTFDCIDIDDAGVTIGEISYKVWDSKKQEVEPVIGANAELDVPFTMWELSGFAASARYILRLQLRMGKATFQNQIGSRDVINLYGESILLDKIESEDLSAYRETNPEQYENYRVQFERFQSGIHLIPDIYEFLLVSADGTELGWETSSVSPMLSPRLIADDDLQRATCWFVNDIAHNSRFLFVGRRSNSFAVKASRTGVRAVIAYVTPPPCREPVNDS